MDPVHASWTRFMRQPVCGLPPVGRIFRADLVELRPLRLADYLPQNQWWVIERHGRGRSVSLGRSRRYQRSKAVNSGSATPCWFLGCNSFLSSRLRTNSGNAIGIPQNSLSTGYYLRLGGEQGGS